MQNRVICIYQQPRKLLRRNQLSPTQQLSLLKSFHHRSRAKAIALATKAILESDRTVMRWLRRALGIVKMSSRLTTHFAGIPSSSSKTTSTGMPLTGRVTAAQVIEVL